tara:strand:+ start:593 stop:1261 length:669 start_codon:yes stop_codon:yes gene_type:complete
MNALILARGGSKGVPRKNIKDLCGKPLIYYPIEVAKKSKQISEIYVSTDDEEIANIATYYGAQVIIRPPELANDNSLDVDSFIHFCNIISTNDPIVHLRVTTPLISEHKVDEAIIKFKKNIENFSSLRSAHETPESAFKQYIKGEKYWLPISESLSTKPRQECPITYTPNGYIDIVKPTIFKETKTFYGDKIYPFITKFTPEIDTLDDFNYIEYLIRKNKIN